MLQFRSKATGGELFVGRDDYLKNRTDGAFRGKPRLCNAIARANDPLRSRTEQDGFPWVTMVLGSGCVEARDLATGSSLEAYPALVRRILKGLDDLPDGTIPADLAGDFTASLIADRLGSSRQATGDVCDATDVHSEADRLGLFTAEVVLCAALLTKLYHHTKATSANAMNRFGDDIAILDDEQQISAEIRSSLLGPVLGILEALDEHETAKDSLPMLDALVKSIKTSLDKPAGGGRRPQLRSDQVKLMTEISWYILTEGTTVYPGWSDMLLHLSIQEDTPSLSAGLVRPKITELRRVPPLIMQRLAAVTEYSWSTLRGESSLRGESPRSDRDRFYDTAAAVLHEQVEYRSQLPKFFRSPLVSAFVTSFDLELEMALWCAPDAQPFVLAVPVNLLIGLPSSKDRAASTCWLGCIIRPAKQPNADLELNDLRNPAEWFVLNDVDLNGPLGSMPFIVRLNGCPLLKLPSLIDEQGAWKPFCLQLLSRLDITCPDEPSDEDDSPLDLEHAILIDEHAAMQQTAIELFTWGTGDTDTEIRHGIPLAITGTPNDHTARFWMVMGVQIGDSIVRYRFASQIASRDLTTRSDSNRVAPEHAGIVINRRIDESVHDLLHWYGFDVVRDDCESFREDLDHYVRHLIVHKRSKKDAECEIK